LLIYGLPMKLNVYVDAFNLYYGCLMGTAHKWLDLHAFAQGSFPADTINRIRYFTARVNARPHDPDQPVRQDTYFRALRTLPNLSIHEGSYIEKPVRMAQYPIPAPPTPATIVTVLKSEEKGSDVNLATYLLIDAFDNDYEGAVVISNDSDLAEPIRLVRTKFKRRVVLLHPCSRPGRRPSVELRKAVGLRAGKPSLIVQPALLATSQFPSPMTDANGTFHKPASW
jgi:NYN domain